MFHQTTLDNGLVVLGEVHPGAASVGLGVFVRTGSRDETREISGVSHFLEHMMFKGSANRSALQLSYDLGAIGAQANAYTTNETTVYYMSILPEYLKRGVELLSEMMTSTLDAQELEMERKVILEEIALYQDRPTFVLLEKALESYFKSHQAGNSVLGTTQTVAGISREQMLNYFKGRYSPENMVFVASGSFDWNDFLSLVTNYCEQWQSADASREILEFHPVERDITIEKANIEKAYYCVLGEAPSAQDSSRYAAKVLSCILGDSSGSHCYWRLIDKGLADMAAIESDEMDGVGVVYGYASSDPKQIKEVGYVIDDILLGAKEFTDEQLTRAKIKLSTRLALSAESPSRRMMSVGNEWIYRQDYQTIEDIIGLVQSVNRADILKMLEVFRFKPIVRVTLLPA